MKDFKVFMSLVLIALIFISPVSVFGAKSVNDLDLSQGQNVDSAGNGNAEVETETEVNENKNKDEGGQNQEMENESNQNMNSENSSGEGSGVQQGSGGEGNGSENGNQQAGGQEEAGNSENGQNQEQTKTQNSGEESKLAVQNGETRRNQVASAVEEMKKIGDSIQGETGEKIRQVAQQQGEAQENMESTMQKVQNRNGVVKFLIGPDYGKIRDIEAELEKNQLRIQEMTQIANELGDSEEADAIMQQIAIMEQAEVGLKADLEEEKGNFSMFGWLFKWLV